MLAMLKRDPSRLLSEGEHHGVRWTVLNNGCGYRCGYVLVPHPGIRRGRVLPAL